MLLLLFGATGRVLVKTGQILSLHSRPGSAKAVGVITPSFNQSVHKPTNGQRYSPQKPGKMAIWQDTGANHLPDGH
jgi:hypothetical protein